MKLTKKKNGFYYVKFSNGKERSLQTRDKEIAEKVFDEINALNGDSIIEQKIQTSRALRSNHRNPKKREGTKGFIYIFSNPCFQYLKIGLTQTAPNHRCYHLSTSSAIPLPFEVEFAVEVDNVFETENKIHIELERHRINKKKEFFNLTLPDAKRIVRRYGRIYYDSPESSTKVTILRQYKNFKDYKNSTG